MAEEINELPKSKPLRDKKKKFADNFIENGGDARKAALDAGYGEQYVRDKLWQIIEDPAVQAKITQALSKEGMRERKPEFYAILYKCLKAETHPKISATEAKSRAGLIKDVIESDMSEEMKRRTLDSIDSSFSTTQPANQTRLWAFDIFARIMGEYAPLKQEHSFTDPLEGKTRDEQDAILKEAEEVLRRVQGG